MKKILSIGLLLSVITISTVSAHELNTLERENVFLAIAKVERMNGYDIADMRKFSEIASEQELLAYLSNAVYQKSVLIDNPNEMDKQDLKMNISKKPLIELTDLVQHDKI